MQFRGWVGTILGTLKKQQELPERKEAAEVNEQQETYWRARRDSNSRPIAPEAV